MTQAALIQLNSSDDPVANLRDTVAFIRNAAGAGAKFILTPEATNCVSASRTHQNNVLMPEGEDATLAALCALALELKVWLLIGSIALKTSDSDGRFANRSFLISPTGQIIARYDKIHMFDVTVSKTEVYRESAGYRPGRAAVVAQTDFGPVGMSICYDLRFAYLYRQLAHAGAQILTVPSAFSPVTGAAHWEALLRARAIETGCYVLAPAQVGTHDCSVGKPRKTWGHSLAVAPWGEVLVDGGTDVGFSLVDLDLAQVEAARSRIPSLSHDRNFEGP